MLHPAIWEISAVAVMRISMIKKLFCSQSLIVLLMLCLAVLALSACGKKGGADNKPTESNSSGTVSIYYKDDVSSETVYDDVISDKDSSADGDLAGDATPELIIPSDKKPDETSSANSSQQSVQGSSKPAPSTDSSQNASSSVPQETTSSEESSSQSSSTSSYDKGYTKPY